MITGTALVNEDLTAATTGIVDIDGVGTTFTYQWFAAATADAAATELAGATSATYTILTAQEGQFITVRVTYTDDGATDETLTSAPTAAVVMALGLDVNDDGGIDAEDTLASVMHPVDYHRP